MSAPVFMLAREIKNRYGWSDSTLWRRVRDGRQGIGVFPLPVYIPNGRRVWRRSEIEAWEAALATVPPPRRPTPAPAVPAAKKRGLA